MRKYDNAARNNNNDWVLKFMQIHFTYVLSQANI